MRALKHVAVWHNVTAELFQQEIAPLNEPAILKGLIKNWPIVVQVNPVNQVNSSAGSHNQRLIKYLSDMYVGGDVRMAQLNSGEKGRFFYNQTMNGFNFERKIMSFELFIEQLEKNAQAIKLNLDDRNNAAVAIQSAPVKDYFPSFIAQHDMPLFTDEPRFWLGNKSTVVAHYDDAENIACVVAGRRRVTLFPPEQIANLYVGPLEFTPAGAPVTLVDLHAPDFEKFPKLKQALNFALVAELEPGDALYIPTLWWHHVDALSDINMLVNYWSGGSIVNKSKPVPMDALLLAILTIRDLPAAQKKAWQSFFNFHVFEATNRQYQHIPAQLKGVLNTLTDEQKLVIKKWLLSQLS